MEISEFTLLMARTGVLVLMYLLLLVFIFALRADARAAIAPFRTKPRPAPAKPTAPTSQVHSLTVIDGTLPTSGREYQLFGPLEIGRSIANNISIPNNIVSTHHARLFSKEGRWMVEDLGSTNGTSLNGKPVTTVLPLHAGDKIVIGDTVFQIQ